MSIEDDIAFFERVPTLRLLGRAALRILAIGAESRYVLQGEVLFAAGEPTDVPRRSPSRGPPFWKSVVLRRKTLCDVA